MLGVGGENDHSTGQMPPAEGGDLSSLAGLEGGTSLNFLGRCLLCKVQVSGVG